MHQERARAWWNGRSEEERAAIRAKQRATYEARYPHRVALYAELQRQLAEGELERQPCDRCGGPGAMQLRYDDEAKTVEIDGWRCYPCRKAVADA